MQVYQNGAVLTMDQNRPVAGVLCTKGKKIAYVGDEVPEQFKSAPSVDLAGRAVIPPVADSHVHFTSYATFASGLFVYDAFDIDSLMATINDYARLTEGVIIGFGVSPWALKELRLPTPQELDRAGEGRPVFLVKYDGHSAVVNRAMIEALPEQVQKERGFHSDAGLVDSEAFYSAAMAVTENISTSDIVKNVTLAAHDLAQKGFGVIHAVEGIGFKKDLDVTGLLKLARALPIETRLFFQTLDLKKVNKLKLPRVGGCFACALDGAFGTKDAALHEPYLDNPDDRGVLFYDQDKVDNFVAEAHKQGLQVSFHAIGDRAVTQALDAFEKALEQHPRDDHRHTIIHASLVTERDKDRIADMGINIAIQPAMLTLRQEPLSYLETIIGRRAEQVVPVGSLVKRGVKMSFGSDAPVTLPNLGTSLHTAVTHPGHGEAVDVMTALEMHTLAVCEMSFDDDRFGRLIEGRSADFVILGADPRSMPPEELADLTVDTVIRQGRPLPENPGGTLALLGGMIKGFLAGRRV